MFFSISLLGNFLLNLTILYSQVCTFSSNVCRLAYELRFALRPFVVDLYEVISVDMNYFFQYGQEFTYSANHKRPPLSNANASELIFVKGDLIHTPLSLTHAPKPKYWGTNLRTQQYGHFLRAMLTKKYLSSDTYPPFI